ncbi:MAG: hypothetical protein JO019_01765 [Candidatus Kaiserbacteria bacterium]|nr:hypothetical protein [Candidatus Kaiserbacteria bacterium]
MDISKFIALIRKDKRGFTLLLAALVASIVLMLGSSIFAIAQKQVTLSSIGRDSQFAFYAADTGAECALYYDIRFHAFATSTQSAGASTIVCDGSTVTTSVTAAANAATSTFQLDLFTANQIAPIVGVPNCVQVTVAKNPSSPYTVIHADGYSTSCGAVDTSVRALQRSVELHY